MTRLSFLFLLSLVIHTLQGAELPDYQYDEYEYKDYKDPGPLDEDYSSQVEEEIEELPTILTEPKTILVDRGTTIVLPCMMDFLPNQMPVMWTRPDRQVSSMLAVGGNIQIQEYKTRANVETTDKGSILNIGVAKVEDAGQYKCTLGVQDGANSKASVTHTVSIRVPPSISKHSDTSIETEKGKMVLMECRGTGTPTPTVKWTKVDRGKMPDGSDEVKGEEVIINKVDRHHAGVYRCTADNGFGNQASKDIDLRVLYKPEIEVEEVFIHTKAGNEAELVCHVHGFPHPQVEWKKDGQPVVENNKIKMQKLHSKYSLTIKAVEKSDFGKYTCHAKSERGSAQETMEISGLAGSAEFKSDPTGLEPSSYVLEWVVVSYSPVTAFRVETREDGTTAWTEANVVPIPDGPYHYAGKLFLKEGMTEATRYEARVYARNDEGWNKPHPIFNFATKGADLDSTTRRTRPKPNVNQEPKQEGITAGANPLVSTVLCVVVLALRLFI